MRKSILIITNCYFGQPSGKIFNLRDNESNADFGYKKTIAILIVATGDLGFKPKC